MMPTAIPSGQKTGYLKSLTEKFRQSRPFQKLYYTILNDRQSEITVTGLAGSSSALLLSCLLDIVKRPIVVLLSDQSEANDSYDDLTFLLGENRVCLFPSHGTPPFEFRSPSAEIIGMRMSTISRLLKNDTVIVVAPVAAVIEPTITLTDFKSHSLLLEVGDDVEIPSLVGRLNGMGFRKVPVVEEMGDFALRGGLIDFFSPGHDYPIRVEFLGDEIDTIREFDVVTQRTVGKLSRVELLPRREIPITEGTIEEFLEKIPAKDAELIRARYLNDPDLPGLEWLATYFGLERGCFGDFIPPEALFFLEGSGNLEAIANNIRSDAEPHYQRLRERIANPPGVEDYYISDFEFKRILDKKVVIDKVPFKGGRENIIDFECREHPALGARLDLLSSVVKNFHQDGVTYFIAADNVGQAGRLEELLSEKLESISMIPIEVARFKGGFISRENRLALLTDHQIFGRYSRRPRRRKFKEGVALQDYTSLTEGDYVVHTDFGIARYDGLVSIMADGRMRDCLQLTYAEGDKLYVPIEEFNRVSKYSGKDSAPKLSSFRGGGWEKVKARTKKAIADMAADLIKIYAERKVHQGYSFGPDTTWMKQLEASFPYEETADQMKAIEDIKKDMESPVPMDRLICGDVGYGKTEVAIRAAFKAVESDKQVALLVPTTILAQQHLATFTRRLSDFPVRIEMLSRFRTKKEQIEIIKDLADGKIDIIIGTHRLLSKDIKFADLGLLIIDEEQRFGVKHKESLRKIKATIDTIALTATPIPRTLQMSLMGARDMSLINTSPKDRYPILTHIFEFNPEIIAEAILSEIDRGGQVFFVHNRVQSIEAIYRYLKRLVPQVEIAVAHGQMHERSLEGMMLAFLSGRFQVLLSTSIIESGLDIPSVNTIIVNRSDRFGLAQLYQLRGRVGRSSIHARAYFLTPPYRLISSDARKRLRAIETHADLGSGFALAMKDLEIRGAGNILGAQQSGFIEEVGFDLYTRLLEEAVAELKGEKVVGIPDTKLEIDIDVLIPDSYIDIHYQKVEIYQRVAGARTLDDIEKIRTDIEDRFGKIPASVNNLLEAGAVSVSAWAKGIYKVRIKSGLAELFFAKEKKLRREEIEGWRRVVDYSIEFSISKKTSIKIDLTQLETDFRLPYLRMVLNSL
jgi:transcription-repair coupling factor (superfamily II helicase)